MPKAVIYARFSSHNQREESIEQQVAECQAFAKANDLTVVDVYAARSASRRSSEEVKVKSEEVYIRAVR